MTMEEKTHVKHRRTARVMLLSHQNSIFLLKTHFDPEVGLPPRWLTPGGGIDNGETPLQAAIRELREETGLIIQPEDLDKPVLITSGRWDWADGQSFHTYEDTIYELLVEEFKIDNQGFTKDEHRDILEYRWWKIDELLASDESVGPHELRAYLETRFGNNR